MVPGDASGGQIATAGSSGAFASAGAGVEAGGSGGAPSAGSAAGQVGTAGSLGGGGSVNPCGVSPTVEPESQVAPTPISADASTVTSLNHGNFDDAATNLLEPSAGAGMELGAQKNSNVWQWRQSSAWLEYSLNVEQAGSYGIAVMYYASAANASTAISVDGTSLGRVRYLASADAGEYGGVPNCCARGHGVVASLGLGTHKLRVKITPGSTPLDIYGVQVNFAGQELARAGEAHPLSATEPTLLAAAGVTDFYRMNYDAQAQAWPCQKSFCLVEYLVQTERAGRYGLSINYQKTSDQCMGVEFLVDGKGQGPFRLAAPAGATEPISVDLPCGASRITVRDPNYVDGEFCSYGALLGALGLAPAP